MNAPLDAAGSTGAESDLAVNGDKLKALAGDLDTMQEVLKKQLLRMDEIVDGIEARWLGPASEAYRAKHRAAAEDAVRIRQTMKLLAKAIRLSKDGFSAQELAILDAFRRLQSHTDIQAETDALSTPNTTSAPQPGIRSRIADL
ncbi:type VII secretion system (Wss) protein ESAT-6 [Streptomyces sp. 2132.2]|uniref:WXG100 family type VII secretion target n=1 Tax=Streptomyces sp. 2132.2 TaxID=2485161 RepID=UPI000F987B65|nr:WXG100 family type VII secretion target [Streptomyces sp. 2132.2]ROQ98548.1 type VII secretion system (Wss) protein ESAT-6 [Streptomyces sp. 2132.2]